MNPELSPVNRECLKQKPMNYTCRIIVCLFLLFFFQRMDVATAQKKHSANDEIGKIVNRDLVEP